MWQGRVAALVVAVVAFSGCGDDDGGDAVEAASDTAPKVEAEDDSGDREFELVEGPSATPPSSTPAEGVEGGGRQAYSVAYRSGEEFVWQVSLLNEGPDALDVVGLPLDGVGGSLFEPVETTIRRADAPEGSTPEAFRPFTLEPGVEWLVFHKVRWADCDPGTVALWDYYDVDVADDQAAGLPDPYQVPLRYPVQIGC